MSRPRALVAAVPRLRATGRHLVGPAVLPEGSESGATKSLPTEQAVSEVALLLRDLAAVLLKRQVLVARLDAAEREPTELAARLRPKRARGGALLSRTAGLMPPRQARSRQRRPTYPATRLVDKAVPSCGAARWGKLRGRPQRSCSWRGGLEQPSPSRCSTSRPDPYARPRLRQLGRCQGRERRRSGARRAPRRPRTPPTARRLGRGSSLARRAAGPREPCG